jgi:hypothetical protein
MDGTDIKVLLLNATTLAISFSQIESILKLVLLVASIIYTVQRSHNLYKNKKGND